MKYTYHVSEIEMLFNCNRFSWTTTHRSKSNV